MIIARLDGGLGNQMFQYAFAAYLAKQHQTELYLDLSAYDDRPQHGFLLDRFQISSPQVPAELYSHIPARYQPQAADSWLKRWFPFSQLRRHKERVFGFRSHQFRAPNNSYLVGYWQSEQYFPGIREDLLREFQLRNRPSSQTSEVADTMRDCASITMHIRRGDYLSNPSAAAIYENLSLEYYRASLSSWIEHCEIAEPEVFVFSNDVAWCRAHLKLSAKTHFVDHNNAATAHEDLWLMTQSKACVIANSTFSWWGAYLNDSEEKQVYAPARWFQPGCMDDSAILCADWHAVPLSSTVLHSASHTRAA